MEKRLGPDEFAKNLFWMIAVSTVLFVGASLYILT